MKRTALFLTIIIALRLITFLPGLAWTGESRNVLVHMKTALSKDDAQICVAYNAIMAALGEGRQVSVLIDASAVNTYKKGWRGKDDLEAYKLPESLKQELSRQFGLEKGKIPATYGDYLALLHDKGAQFYINGAMLVVSGISKEFGDLSKLSVDFFEPVNLREMVRLFEDADAIIVY